VRQVETRAPERRARARCWVIRISGAEGLEPGSSAAVIVWENVWARRVTQAMREAGGVVLAFERLPRDVVQAAREWALEQAKV
jgi:hypothetical protein